MVRKECMKKFLRGVIAPSFGAMQNDSMSLSKAWFVRDVSDMLLVGDPCQTPVLPRFSILLDTNACLTICTISFPSRALFGIITDNAIGKGGTI
jgi:hypothetical protein